MSYRDPEPEELLDPMFERIWQTIKSWDINVPSEYRGYCGAMGNHVCAIMDAIRAPMAMILIEERWKKIQGLSLKKGSHSPEDYAFCFTEAVAFVAGEEWSDAPECACPVISAFLRLWNDALPGDADRDRLLKPLIPKIVGTRNRALEEKRSLMAADWLVRVHTPAWLRLAGLTKQADSLEQLPEIISMAQMPSIKGPIEAVRQDAAAAWAVARDAARAAAGNAAWDAVRATARAAARDAAGAVARTAAWAAVSDATGDAARDAARAAAGNALIPTVVLLQKSALELIERMIEAKP